MYWSLLVPRILGTCGELTENWMIIWAKSHNFPTPNFLEWSILKEKWDFSKLITIYPQGAKFWVYALWFMHWGLCLRVYSLGIMLKGLYIGVYALRFMLFDKSHSIWWCSSWCSEALVLLACQDCWSSLLIWGPCPRLSCAQLDWCMLPTYYPPQTS